MVEGERDALLDSRSGSRTRASRAPRGMLVFDIELISHRVPSNAQTVLHGRPAIAALRSSCSAGVLVVGLASPGSAGVGRATSRVKLDGYAEWQPARRAGRRRPARARRPADEVEGQVHDHRRRAARATKCASTASAQPDGAVLAREIDVRPNGKALFETDVQKGTDELEGLWLRNGEAFEADAGGRRCVIGEIEKRGPRVDRVRRPGPAAWRRRTSISRSCAST